MSNALTINDVKVAINEVLKDNEHIELSVTKAINKYDEKLKDDLDKLCIKNVDKAVSGHKASCSGSKSDKKPYYMILTVVIERILQKIGIT